MTITIETLQANIRSARAQEESHRSDMHACAGAAQAYEQLLTGLIQAQRAENAAIDPTTQPPEGKAFLRSSPSFEPDNLKDAG